MSVASLLRRGGVIGVPTLALDTFTRSGVLNASNADTGQTWAGDGTGALGTNGTQLYPALDSTLITYLDVGTPNQNVSMVLAVLPTANYVGVVARFTDTSNFYLADVGSAGDARFFKCVAGVFTSLGTAVSGTFVAGDTIGCSAIGTSIRLMKNGVALVTVTDAGLTTGNLSGIRPNTAGTTWRGDDFKVLSA